MKGKATAVIYTTAKSEENLTQILKQLGVNRIRVIPIKVVEKA